MKYLTIFILTATLLGYLTVELHNYFEKSKEVLKNQIIEKSIQPPEEKPANFNIIKPVSNIQI